MVLEYLNSLMKESAQEKLLTPKMSVGTTSSIKDICI